MGHIPVYGMEHTFLDEKPGSCIGIPGFGRRRPSIPTPFMNFYRRRRKCPAPCQ